MSEVGQTVIKTIITLVTTAFGLVAGLAWNDAIQKLIDSVMGAGDALTGLFIIIHLCYCSNYNCSCRNHYSC